MGTKLSRERRERREKKDNGRIVNTVADHLEELMEYLKKSGIELPTRFLNNSNVDIRLLRNVALQT